MHTPTASGNAGAQHTTWSGPATGHDHGDFPRRVGRYDLLRRLGAGGMGVVYAALDRERGRRVALKTLRALEPGSLYRLKNEFRSAAGIIHPNLVALHELVSDDDQWFITMEYVEGVRFGEYVRSDSSLHDPASHPPGPTTHPSDPPSGSDAEPTTESALVPPQLHVDRLRDALAQLVAGVSALHAAGKLHRDLKSSNVLVTNAGRVVVLDFGLVSDRGAAPVDATLDDGILGTPAYMSPEQAAGKPATPASDWYAVGVMLYEALTGRLPFVGTTLKILSAKQQQDPPHVRELAPEAPADLAELSMGLLRRDPQARLSGVDVLQRLAQPGAPGSATLRRVHTGPIAHSPHLLGRDDLVAALHDAYEATSKGQPVTVYVHGGSGIGKTALIDHVLTAIRRNGEAVILHGRCYERETVPFKAFDSVVDSLTHYLRRLPQVEAAALMPRDVHELTRLFPVLARVTVVADAPQRVFEGPDQQEARRRGFRGLKELLARIADRRPLVLRIADLQWGDEDSARLLAELLSPPDAPALLLIGSYRSDEASGSPMLRELQRLYERPGMRGDVRNIFVPPLTHKQAEALALSRMGRGDGPALAEAARIAVESEGNPLFVEELVRHAASRRRRGDNREISLEQLVLARLDGLPPPARHLLEVVAVAGRPVPQNLAITTAALAGDDHTALDLLRSQHLVRTHGAREADTVECYHDRVRLAVLGQLSRHDLVEHHRNLADAFEREGGDPEVTAHHFQAAGVPERAVRFACVAAERAAAALAFNRAAELYRLAFAWSTPPSTASGTVPASPPSRQQLLRQRADVLVLAGRSGEAAPLYLEAAVNMPSAESLELRRRAAEQYLVSGRIDDGVKHLRPVLTEVGLSYPPTPSRANMSIITRSTQLSLRGIGFKPTAEKDIAALDLLRTDVCLSAGKGLGFVDPVRGYSFFLRGLLLALQTGEPRRIARALAMVGSMMISRGTVNAVSRGTTFIKEARKTADALGDPYLLGLTDIISGVAQITLGHWKHALGLLDAGVQLLHDRCAGTAWEVGIAQMSAHRALLMTGDIGELASRSHAWLREAEDAGDLHGEVWAALFSGFSLLAGDEIQGARDRSRGAIRRWSQDGFHFQHMLALALETYCDLYQGRGGAAWQRLSEQWAAVETSHILHWQFLRIFGLQVRALAAVAASREQPHAEAVLLAAAERDASQLDLDAESRRDSAAGAALIRACIAFRTGDRSQALSALDLAIAGYEATDMKIHAACARRRKGELTGGHPGAAMVAEADRVMIDHSIANPRQWTAMYAPGFE
ncbi:MAG: protein kinase [Myxococcales bacterium]|nr:protein kinase [Myxococcales bacterium]